MDIDELIAAREGLPDALRSAASDIKCAAGWIARALTNGHKLLIFGNGGSAADAQHMAAELVGRFGADRPGRAAIALTTDSSALTAIANDWSYDYVFQRQLEALGRPNDVVLGISTSGESKSVVDALEYACEHGMYSIGLTGRDGGMVGPSCMLLINVGGVSTPIIQERMLAVEHIICALVDSIMGVK